MALFTPLLTSWLLQEAYGKEYKHQNHLMMLESMMGNQLPQISEICRMYIMDCKPTSCIGQFWPISFIDINYSNLTDFTEMELQKPAQVLLTVLKMLTI